jgi:hypothetical protein
MSQEIDLLTKLYAFYSRRYNGSTLEEKFNAAVYDLVKTGDVQKATYMEFCVDNNIEPYVAPAAPVRPAPAPQPAPTYYHNDGCGGGGGYQRSSC